MSSHLQEQQHKLLNINDGHHDLAHEKTYENALKILDSLISRKVTSDVGGQEQNLEITSSCLRKIGIDITKLPMIHVAGTKGKGSTCAFCESILRKNGLKTGLFTSPHLIDIRERIRINGAPVSTELFGSAFWECYDKLCQSSLGEKDLIAKTTYFRLLVVLAFKIFVDAGVDVAIIEVGIGGRYDATNIIHPVVCGISSIGYDHMEILGNSLYEIAMQKAGIMKKYVPCITYPQREEAMDAFVKSSQESGSPLYMCPSIEDYERVLSEDGKIQRLELGLKGEHQRWNASLAIALAFAFMERTNRHGKLEIPSFSPLEESIAIEKFKNKLRGEDVTSNRPSKIVSNVPSSLLNSNMAHIRNTQHVETFLPFHLSEAYINGLRECKWPGRCQVLSFPGLSFYIDGAHTDESLDLCRKWFVSCMEKNQVSQQLDDNYYFSSDNEENASLTSERRRQAQNAATTSTHKKILVFNFTGPRDPKKLLAPLSKSKDLFDYVIFCPTDSVKNSLNKHHTTISKQEEEKLNLLRQTWCDLTNKSDNILLFHSINEVLEFLWDMKSEKVSVLATGSIYLIGDFSRKLHKIYKAISKGNTSNSK
ncbi:hypothetical protein FDP41_004386 [Naegleria fowleri]|uniref:tetrahydrofolate synthase n=1 Tax=Naegleria fowleri TaxID=5763 RepID=A0A6A5BHT7_NAEFO|nr:uncharacterized protein FDP41_004386 [Naegleria fowleri]KAF0976487.1 hypothetical protein FDP41_004386 [Naegleria fowleri]CAG4715792.1 unnamed protein product [Naegleria fowleri]